jgi:hypothetical protein
MRAMFLTMAIVLGAASAAFAGSNLINDGGFEHPKPPPGGVTEYNPGDTMGAWTVTGTGNVSINSTTQAAGPAWRGAAFLDLTGNCDCGPGAGVAQTIATTPGATYILTFRVGTLDEDSPIMDPRSTVQVYQGSTLLITAENKKIRTFDGQSWKRFNVLFTATDAQTTLTFVGDDKAGDLNCGLDGVQVEPAS